MIPFLLRYSLIRHLHKFVKSICLPGFDGLNVYELVVFFFKRINEKEVQSKARSIAFSFFLALFPALIFIFTLIPYIPVEGFQEQLLNLFRDVMPPNTYEASRLTIEDILTHQRGGLLSFGILFTLYIASSGINSLIDTFSQVKKRRPAISSIKQRMLAMGLTALLAFLFFLTIAFIIFSKFSLHYLVNKIELKNNAPIYILQGVKWLILVLLCITAISCIYYYGTTKNARWKFISAGSTMATFLIILTALGFNYYINNFAQYNKLYGSIGTLIIILLWIYFNCLQLIIGYELNTFISVSNKEKLRGMG